MPHRAHSKGTMSPRCRGQTQARTPLRAETADEPRHYCLRATLARAWAVHGVAFLAHSPAVGCTRRLGACPDPHQRILVKVIQRHPNLQPKPPVTLVDIA